MPDSLAALAFLLLASALLMAMVFAMALWVGAYAATFTEGWMK